MAKCGGVDTILVNCNSSTGSGAIIDVINIVVDIMSVLVGILAVVGIVYFGIQYMMSRDNEQNLMKAKARIYNIVIGLVAYVLMYVGAGFLLPGGKFNVQNGGGYTDDINMNVSVDDESSDDVVTHISYSDGNSVAGDSVNNKIKVKLFNLQPKAKPVELEVEKDKILTKPTTSDSNKDKFDTWRTADGEEYDFSSPVTEDLNLYAQWYPRVSYSMKKRGKWIFINNPEEIHADVLANNGHLIYRDTVPSGDTEIYYEHGITYDNDFSYALRFWNPNNTPVTIKINRCGVSDSGWNMHRVWEQYYGYCSLAGQTLTVQPQKTLTIFHGNAEFVVGAGTDSGGAYKFRGGSGDTHTGIFDGALNITVSGGNLNMAALAWTGNYADTFEATYEGNYTLSTSNPGRIYTRVYSGSYGMLPEVEQESTFYINDGTPAGKLKWGWKGQDKTEKSGNNLDTNTVGGEPHKENGKVFCNTDVYPDAFTSDIVNLRVPDTGGRNMVIGGFKDYYDPRDIFVQNGDIYSCNLFGWPWNWSNWAVKYNDKITLINDSSRERTVSFRINVYSDENMSAVIGAVYNGAFQMQDEGIITVWTVSLAPGESRTMEAIVLKGGNSGGGSQRYIEVD